MRMKFSLILFASLLLFAHEASANWIKYCKEYQYEKQKKDIFVGSPGKNYPHIHCGKNFITFSESGSKTYLASGDDVSCDRIKTLLATPKAFDFMKDSNQAKALVMKLKNDFCSKDINLMTRLLMHLLLEN